MKFFGIKIQSKLAFQSEPCFLPFKKSLLETLVKTNCIDNPKKIWWDLRLHPFYDTIEFRICDMCLTVDETMCIVAIIQAIVAKLYKLSLHNMSFNIYRLALIKENKFRAARYGIEGNMIDFGLQKEVETKSLILELLDFIDDVVDELGSREQINYVHTILKEGTNIAKWRSLKKGKHWKTS